jgi:pyrroline-5-carboxylate reductase
MATTKETIGIIGAGNMGYALAKGLSAAEGQRKLLIYDTDEEKARGTASACAAATTGSAEELIEKSGTIVIAIKPQHLSAFFSRLEAETKERRFISIVAGTRIATFQEKLQSSQVVRFMPNLAATVSASVVGVAVPEGIDEEFRMDSLSIAEALGTAVPLPEELISAVTGLSGSGIAYVFAFLHAMALGGTQAGIPYNTSLGIAQQTMRGALEVLEQGDAGPSEMLTRVASAGGTTIQGLRALEERGFTAAVMDAINKAADRASEFEGDS